MFTSCRQKQIYIFATKNIFYMKFKIGRNCVVDPAANQIFIKNGAGEQSARLEPRMMRVLLFTC